MLQSTFIIGGARSGKSSFAQSLAESSGRRPVYLATAQAWDQEMADRIQRHQSDRGPSWSTVEEPLDLEGALAACSTPEHVVLVDCLTLWVTNLMTQTQATDREMEQRFTALAGAIRALPGPVILVANEVGLGIVPADAMARRFRDLAGWCNQAVAAACNTVYFIAAGLPLALKG